MYYVLRTLATDSVRSEWALKGKRWAAIIEMESKKERVQTEIVYHVLESGLPDTTVHENCTKMPNPQTYKRMIADKRK